MFAEQARRLKEAGLTSILISEYQEAGIGSLHGVEEYVVDGVVQLQYSSKGPDAGRRLTIKKMRGTPHSEDIHPLKFVERKGMEVLSADSVLP